MPLPDWRTSSFTKHGNRGDPKRARLSRPTAQHVGSSRAQRDWQKQEAHLLKQLARARYQLRKAQDELVSLKKPTPSPSPPSKKDNDVYTLLRTTIIDRDTARQERDKFRWHVAKCKSAYGKLARKYNHLLEYHVKNTSPNVDTYGSNLTDTEQAALDFEATAEQVQADIDSATTCVLASDLGLTSSLPVCPVVDPFSVPGLDS